MGLFDFVGGLFDSIWGIGPVSQTNDANASINKKQLKFQEEQNRLSREFNAEQAQLNRDFQENMMEKQFSMNRDYFDYQNEYNSPYNSVKRAEAAGINPNAIFGGVTVPAQAVGSSSAASGSAASSSPLGAPSMLPMQKGKDLIDMLDAAIGNGSQFLDSVLNIGQKKADAKLKNEEARKLKIENDREESYNNSVGKGLVVNKDTGEIKLIGQLTESERNGLLKDDSPWESFTGPDSGTMRAYIDTSEWLTKMSDDKLKRAQNSFEQLVAEKMPYVKVKIGDVYYTAAEAIARMRPQEFRQKLLDAAKTVQDTATSKSQEDLNKENKTAVQNQNQGVSHTGKALSSFGDKGVFHGTLDVIKGVLLDVKDVGR